MPILQELKDEVKFLNVDLGKLSSSLNSQGLYSEEQIEAFLSTIADYHGKSPKKKYGVIGNGIVLEQIKEALKQDKFKSLMLVFDFFAMETPDQDLKRNVENFLATDNIAVVGMKDAKTPYILGSNRPSNPLGFSKTYLDKYGVGEIACLPDKKNNPTSSSARVLSATNQTSSASTVKPSGISGEVNLISGMKNITKEVKISTFSYELKFDETAVNSATKDSVIVVDVVDSASKKPFGSFDVQNDKISSHNVTVEVAIAMMKAYLHAHPQATVMEVNPKNQKAIQAFVEAAKVLKDQLATIKCNIIGASGATVSMPEVKTVPDVKKENDTKAVSPVAAAPKVENLTESEWSRRAIEESSAEHDIPKEWYTDDDINALLKHYHTKENAVIVASVLGSDAKLPNDEKRAMGRSDADSNLVAGLASFKQNLTDILKLNKDEKDKEYYNKEFAVIPINLGVNHWVLCTIKFSVPAHINYIDPLGAGMPSDLKGMIRDVFGKDATISTSREKYQHDKINCGPWVVELFRQMQQNNFSTNDLVQIDISKSRAEHEKILSSPSDHIPSRLNASR